MNHIPALLKEVLQFLDPHEGDFVIDGTINGGGHASAILEKIGERGLLLGLDWDKELIAKLRERPVFQVSRVRLMAENYADISDILRRESLGKAHGLLLDLGFSSEHIEHAGRGFSFEREEPLRMTYDASRKPVAQLLRELSEGEIAEIIARFGEERFARRIAKAIKETGRKRRIETASELGSVIAKAVPKQYERGRIHPATRTFQALRIYANDELGNLTRLLERITEIVRPGGRVVVISFHSLEDRIVKNSFRVLEKRHELKIITKKPVTASREESRTNSRSRSAKLRAAQIQEL